MTFVVEPATDGDLNFIRSTWIRTYSDSLWARVVAPSFLVGHIGLRDDLLDRAPPIVARLEIEPTSICGWACFERGTIHYVFVRPRGRREGVAKLRLAPFLERPAFYTHKTRMIDERRLPTEWTHNPYEAMRRSA